MCYQGNKYIVLRLFKHEETLQGNTATTLKPVWLPSMLLASAYLPHRKKTKIPKTWPEESHLCIRIALKDRIGIFLNTRLCRSTLQLYSAILRTVSTMSQCDKCIWVYPIKEPWMTKEVQTLLKNRNNALRSGRWGAVQCHQSWLENTNQRSHISWGKWKTTSQTTPVSLLFIDFRLAFNTIIPCRLPSKLTDSDLFPRHSESALAPQRPV